MIKPIEHFTIQEASPMFEDGIASYTARAFFQHVCGELDARMMQEIRKTLVEQGYTDLYVINDAFILEAIKREVERRENKPLTVEQLKERDGRPAWVSEDGAVECGIVNLKNNCFREKETIMLKDGNFYLLREYDGKTWLAYDHEPERGDT